MVDVLIQRSQACAMTDPFRPTDDNARALGLRLVQEARFASLGVLMNGQPWVTRVGLAVAPDGTPMSLLSDLAPHTACLRAHATCSLLVGEPPEKGDPLAHPRLTLAAEAEFVEKSRHAMDHYLTQQPKARLYADFADFHLVRFHILSGHLNGGFGRAFRLNAEDLYPKKWKGR